PHLLHAAVDVVLLHLEVGDAVAQQATDGVAALVERDGVAGPGELLRGGEAGRSGTDHRDPAPGRLRRRQRYEPAVVDHPVDDLHLDLLDGDRVVGDTEHTGRLARRRAQPSGELGEVVGGVQRLARVLPALGVDEVVPRRDEIAERTTLVAERDPTVHAPL